ncbi:sulfurtransferase TusE [bacterium BMS3Bbin11]|nr:sulfurtransferase TusE [bacterium BMS3Abin11]GBE46460.1 sulfurtransferase TusE [bacterium BMS3Bbin11]GMT40394.1 MAG: sulfurtransferase TusE [bacterium]HDH08221.1 TusE/DsrC/DsvC family sulfur relay protein [Gammaproteobacteria bacterium]HDH15868.1 TusE/DsrC/DsvC family sulfur relay protein [Gammaproteobacteria bacterium]
MPLKVGEITIPTDEEGYLIDPDDWSREICEHLAQGEGIELNDEYWEIITCMRNYFDDQKIAPGTRYVAKFIAEELGYGKKARNYLFKIFPYGYVKQACKIAGMRHPRAWSTG